MVSNLDSKPAKTKRKKLSKHKKKTWRKTDVKDVDDFLEDKRLEERLGTNFSECADDKLFQIDRVGEKPQKKVSIKRKKKPFNPAQAKCMRILYERSAVPDPVVKRNRVRTPEERKNPILKKYEDKRDAKKLIKSREASILYKEKKRAERPKKGEFKNDLWADEDKETTLGPGSEWLSKQTLFQNLISFGKQKKKMPSKFLEKPSKQPSIVIPHPGMSYNPSYADHQSLLQEVAEIEKKSVKEAKHLDRVTEAMFSKVSEEERERMRLEEMSQGLPLEGKTEEQNEEETDNEYKTVNPPTLNKKKTLKQRKKLKKVKAEELKRKQEKLEKKKVAAIYKLKFLNQDIETKVKKLAVIKERREKKRALKADEPKRLSSIKYTPPELEFNLQSELTGNLRNLQSDGDILLDRFNSLQRRNMIEVGKRRVAKKRKQKKYLKSSHKEEKPPIKSYKKLKI